MNKRIKKKHIPNTCAKHGFTYHMSDIHYLVDYNKWFAQRCVYSEYIIIRMCMSSDISFISKTNFKHAYRYMRGLYSKANLFYDKIIELNVMWKDRQRDEAIFKMIDKDFECESS